MVSGTARGARSTSSAARCASASTRLACRSSNARYPTAAWRHGYPTAAQLSHGVGQLPSCGKFYHLECIKKLPLAKVYPTTVAVAFKARARHDMQRALPWCAATRADFRHGQAPAGVHVPVAHVPPLPQRRRQRAQLLEALLHARVPPALLPAGRQATVARSPQATLCTAAHACHCRPCRTIALCTRMCAQPHESMHARSHTHAHARTHTHRRAHAHARVPCGGHAPHDAATSAQGTQRLPDNPKNVLCVECVGGNTSASALTTLAGTPDASSSRGGSTPSRTMTVRMSPRLVLQDGKGKTLSETVFSAAGEWAIGGRSKKVKARISAGMACAETDTGHICTGTAETQPTDATCAEVSASFRKFPQVSVRKFPRRARPLPRIESRNAIIRRETAPTGCRGKGTRCLRCHSAGPAGDHRAVARRALAHEAEDGVGGGRAYGAPHAAAAWCMSHASEDSERDAPHAAWHAIHAVRCAPGGVARRRDDDDRDGGDCSPRELRAARNRHQRTADCA